MVDWRASKYFSTISLPSGKVLTVYSTKPYALGTIPTTEADGLVDAVVETFAEYKERMSGKTSDV